MALRKNTSIKLQDCSLGIQHEVPIGQSMNGHLPADTDPTYDTDRAVVFFDAPDDGQMGLFNPHVYANSGIHPFLFGIQIQQGSGLAWDVYLTCGDPTQGTPSEAEVHDPAFDIPLASSADFGTGSALVDPGVELLPGQLIRVVLPVASGIASRVIAMFGSTVGAGGRNIK